jgi:hypothetical protein
MFAFVILDSLHLRGHVLWFTFIQEFIHASQNNEPHVSHSYGMFNNSKHIEHFTKSSNIWILSRLWIRVKEMPQLEDESIIGVEDVVRV